MFVWLGVFLANQGVTILTKNKVNKKIGARAKQDK
jgi:hypothetical protein